MRAGRAPERAGRPGGGRPRPGGGEPGLQADLLRHLEIRERPRRELITHLERRGHDAAAIVEEVRAAEAAGWVDDRRFAEMFLRDRRRFRPESGAAVLRALRRRGVPAEVAQAALAALDPPWDEREVAVAAVARRWERWPTGERRHKAVGFLRRRGFSSGIVWSVLDEFERERRGEDDGPAGEQAHR